MFCLEQNNSIIMSGAYDFYRYIVWQNMWMFDQSGESCSRQALGVVTEWSKVLSAIPLPLMVWFTLALGTYQFRFVSWVFHDIFSFVHFISLYTVGGLRAFRKSFPYNMYLFNLQIANHILIKFFLNISNWMLAVCC